ncbi:hypothetical protein SDC9_143703 [bioreactor metagenome]|uniref:Uncharacterized protein n=1 Tax=bioreactor metagenome TaxID=1076179 RepID=A0A645E4S4_9ZZZZ
MSGILDKLLICRDLGIDIERFRLPRRIDRRSGGLFGVDVFEIVAGAGQLAG